MAAELEPASAAGFPFPSPVQPVVKMEEQDPTDPEPWVGAERAGNAPCVVRASPRCPAAPVVKQEPVEEPILCWRVTGNGQLKEGPEALAGFLCSGLEQPQPHPGHVPKEEAEWGETPGPQEELPCVPKEEPLFQQEPDSPDTDETWDSADESSLGCFPRRGSWRGAEPSTWEAAVTNPKLEQGAADRTRRKTVNSPAVQGLRKRKTVLTSGRKRDPIWEYFEEIPSLGKKGKCAKCKQCKKEMQGLVARMKRHRDNCLWGENDVGEDVDVSEEQCGSTGSHLSIRDFDWLSATTSESSVGPLSSSAAIKRISDHKVSVASKRFQSSSKTTTVDGFVVRTGKCQQDPIDEKITRFIYATNSPFRIVHNTRFVEMVECLRPGYTPPGRADVGGRLLDTVYKKELERPRTSHSSLEKMPKSARVTPKERVAQFGKDKFHTDGTVLFCTACSKPIDHVRKQTIVEHMESAKHKRNEKRQREDAEMGSSTAVKKQCTGTAALECPTIAKAHHDTLVLDFVRMCLKADFPLHKMDLPVVRDFLSKHIKGGSAIPKSDQLHSHLPTLFEEEKQRLLRDFDGNFIAVIADETTDFQNRPVLNILFQVLKVRPPRHADIPAPQLVKTVCLGKVNHATISQALISCMVEFSIPLERILAFVTDSASYMAKAWNDVLCNLWSNCVHIHCYANIVALAGNTWRDAFKQVDRFVALMKSLLVKAPACRARFLRYLKEQSVGSPTLPPEPVVTRWKTWFSCVEYHARHYQLYRGFVEQERTEQGDTSILQELASLLALEDLHIDLKYIAESCGRLATALDILQSQKRQIHEVYNTVLDLILWLEHLASSTDNAKGSTVAQSLADKLRQYNVKSKQPAADFLRAVRALDPKQIGAVYTDYETVKLELKLSNECDMEWPVYLGIVKDGFADIEDPIQFWMAAEDRVPSLAKYAVVLLQLTVNSADVERSFSKLGALLSAQLQCLKNENVPGMLQLCFNNPD